MKTTIYVLVSASLIFYGCGKKTETPKVRTFRMGFQNSAPRLDFTLIQQSLNLWTQRADAAMITTEVPWEELLTGTTARKYVTDNYKDLVDYYRNKNFSLWVYIDPENGLNRASDANALVSRGKSIANADMQEVYKNFVMVMDSIIHPEHLGLALETNLIRLLAADSIYQGVKKAVNDVAIEVKGSGSKAELSISIQVEDAWGKFTDKVYHGIDQDVTDFPFIMEVGMSSYPYFFFTKPEDMPTDYYSKLFEGKNIPCFVSEGGWASKTFTSFNNATVISSMKIQQDYITKQSQLLDQVQAIAVFQLAFTDIEVDSLPSTVDPSIQYFSSIGLVDASLQPKPGLTTWDEIFKRPLKVGN